WASAARGIRSPARCGTSTGSAGTPPRPPPSCGSSGAGRYARATRRPWRWATPRSTRTSSNGCWRRSSGSGRRTPARRTRVRRASVRPARGREVAVAGAEAGAAMARPGPLRGGSRGRLADPIFKAAVTTSGVLVLALLAFMIIRTTADAWPIFAKEGLGFFTGTDWDAGQTRDLPNIHGTYGALPFMYGTLVTSAIALLIALPVAIAVALYITQLAPRRLRNPLS